MTALLNRFHTRISKDCFNQSFPMRYQWKANRIDNFTLQFSLRWYCIGFKLIWGFCETSALVGWLLKKIVSNISVWNQTAPQLWTFPPADPNSLYGKVLCVHAHIQGPQSRRIAIMHSKGAFSQSPMLCTTLYRCSALKVNVLSVLHRSQESLRALFANANPQKKWKWKACDSR